jgi:hypothetical protein
MDQTPFERIELAMAEAGPAAALQQLVNELRGLREWHNLFDALMLQKKCSLGLPASRPTSLHDVPENLRKEVEAAYLLAAREAGEGFLDEGDLPNAWMYFKAIREPEKLAEALEMLPDDQADYEKLDRLIQMALYEGVNPEKGIRLMLKGHGTCSTITALDQILSQLSQQQRSSCAKILVQSLYDELRQTVERAVARRIPMLPPDEPLGKLIQGRDWLFEEGACHTDASHLSSVVRFARSIEPPAEELHLALEMAQYGARLDRQLQYGGDPPFGDFYLAHQHFFRILLNQNREAGLKYFRDQLEAEPDERDKPLFAYVLVDLLVRSGQLDDAVAVAERYLTNLGEEVSISFDELCTEAGRLDVLKRVRREQQNLVGFTSALVREAK